MAEFNQDNSIRNHLQEWIQLLEERLNNPKNTWKRCQDLNQDLAEAHQRLQLIERKSSRARTRTLDGLGQEGDRFASRPKTSPMPRQQGVNRSSSKTLVLR